MKKILAVLFCVSMTVLLAACSPERPENIPITTSADSPPESVAILEDGLWPENEYTADLPIPPGTVSWVMLDAANGSCGIQVSGISDDQFDAYYGKLLDSGFSEIEKVAEEEKTCVSIGSIVSDGSRSISLAFSGETLMMTIVNKPLAGSELGFLESGNMTNVYVYAYATYDSENGVQAVTELYVPEGESPKPAFSMVSGMVTIRVGDDSAVHYLGTTADAAPTLGIAVNTKQLGTPGEKGTVIVAGTACADNAAAGCGSFCVCYEITIP